MSDQYIYLFIREDLSPQQQIIQTAHATYDMAVRHGNNEYFVAADHVIPNAVLIGARNENALYDIEEHLRDNNIKFEMFYEPDIKAHTAIATYPLRGQERAPLRKFSTMR